jgi:hypothetical protein
LRSQATLATYVEPTIDALPVQAIDMALVLKVIEPIWTTKPETAGRLRGRLCQGQLLAAPSGHSRRELELVFCQPNE